jgi:hypothetical protein
LIQVWYSETGAGSGRARFVLSRWPATGIDVDLPDPAAELWLDGKRVENTTPLTPADGYGAAVRVPLSDARPGRPTLVLDVRYAFPASDYRPVVTPPHVRSAAERVPTRWQVVPPPDVVLLDLTGSLSTDSRWTWRGGRLVPAPVGSVAELDRWIADGSEPTTLSNEPGLIGRPLEPFRSVRLTALPQSAWSATCSVGVLLVGLLLCRVKSGLGLAAGAIGVAIAITYLWVPQPLSQALSASLPGLLAVLVVVLGQVAVRAYYHRRIANLPGFSRTPVEPSSVAGPKALPAGTAAPS